MNKIKNIIKNKSGASMMFVLAVMLMLMAIGTSALVAAQAAAGASREKSIYNQLNLYADSIQKTIMYSLQVSDDKKNDPLLSDNGKLTTDVKTLAGKILANLYPHKGTIPTNSEKTFTFKAQTTDVNLENVGDIIVKILPTVTVTPQQEKQDAVIGTDGSVIIPEIPWQPETVVITGTVSVTVEVINSKENKKIKSTVTYELSDAYLEHYDINLTTMIIKDAGKWRFISHEKLNV